MTPSIRRRGFLTALGTATLAGCIGDDDGDDGTPVTPVPGSWSSYDEVGPAELDIGTPTAEVNLEVTVEPVVEHLEIPWDLDFDSDGDIYLTERTGQILRFDADELEEVGVPSDAIDAGSGEQDWWVPGGEGGTLGIAVSPSDDYVFVYYTANVGGIENRVVRYPIEGDELGTEEVIIDEIPADSIHNGGRIDFGPDGYLWITTGDAGEVELSRDPDSLAGKILRVDEDGEPAADNPDIGGDPRIFAGGIRNSQGIDWIDEVPLITDHGGTAHDAISVLYPGADYGWPMVRGENEDNYEDHPEIVPPLAMRTDRSWATSGGTWYTGGALETWSNRFVVGTLAYQSVLVVTLTPPGETPPSGGTTYDQDHFDQAATATVHDALQDEIGRVRLLEQGPNGELYAITSNRDGRADFNVDEPTFPLDTDDRLLRIVTK